MTPFQNLSRRKFLGESACTALGSSTIMSTLLNLKMANNAVADGLPATGTDRKTLVCVFLHGGIDSFNLLVPSDARYSQYAAARGNVALADTSLLGLNQIAGGDGLGYGLHPATSGIRSLFNGLGGDTAKRRLSFVSNVGTLVQPTDMAQYSSGSHPLPRSLFSHIDQQEQWQTSLPLGAEKLTGWAGRIADCLHTTHNQDLTSMSLSFDGNNIFQVGQNTQQFVMTTNGALTFSQNDNDADHPSFQKNLVVRSLMEQEYSNMMEKAFAELTKDSVEQQEFVQQHFDSVPDNFITTPMPDTNIGRRLLGALRMIKLRPELGLRRQTIFLSMGGWDHHSALLTPQNDMLAELAPALEAFQTAIEELGLDDSVVTFTASDFARTIQSNGSGTDHAWGGNQMIFGGPVDGGKVLGQFPDLTLGGPDDTSSRGRLLPTTSVDEFFAELLLWFGLSGTSNFETVLPNLDNFFDVSTIDPTDQSTFPLGFLKPNTF
ncbi:MAG: DUF1501 domain-containing protein [Verrucomicrobiaceae bacterium]